MKILFVYSGIMVDNVNGVFYHNFLNAIIERYSALGDLTICVSKRNCESSNQSILKNNIGQINFLFINKENTFKTRFISRKQNREVLRKALINKDLLIVHAPDSVGYTASMIARKMKIPYLAVAIGCPFDSLWNHSLKGKLIMPFSFYNMKKEMKHAKYAIYVTSNFLQQRYPTKGQYISCSDVVIPKYNFEIIKSRIERIKMSDLKRIKIATVAAVNISYKGQQDVIRSIPLLNKIGIMLDYYLVGGGDNIVLYTLAKKLGVLNQVHFVGLLPHEDVLLLLNNVDVYIQPSRQEGLSRAILEAMNIALPCIVTNIGGNPELINSNYLYKPGDIKRLIKLIMNLTPEMMEKMAIENWEKSKEYDVDLLNEKRSAFFNLIKSELYVKE